MEKDMTVNYYRVERAIRYLTANFRSQPDLDVVAEKVSLSPFHFQRMFLDWVGLTPKKFVQYLTINHLRERISTTANMIEAARIAGLSSQSRVYDLFINIEGVSPQQYKSGGIDLEISYGYHATPFGMCFIAITGRGICEFRFIDEDGKRGEYLELCRKWNFAVINHRPELTQTYIQRIFSPGNVNNEKLNLLVQGTDFQIKVWEALLKIPFGGVMSYRQIAREMGSPGSIRQVASAAGQNPVSYLIPCHRIICESGKTGNFSKGKIRKLALISWEMGRLGSES